MVDPFEIMEGKPPTRKNVLAFLIMLPILAIAVLAAMCGWIAFVMWV